MPRIILVPTDFSEHAEHALDYAVALANKLDAKIHLLNVIGIPALGVPELGVAITSTMIDKIVENNQAALDQLAERHGANASIATELATGDARDAIIATAKRLGADLIVMGTHGRRGLSRALLGSVAETVVRTSPCAVLTLRKS